MFHVEHLLPDTKGCEKLIEHILHTNIARQSAERMGCAAKRLGFQHWISLVCGHAQRRNTIDERVDLPASRDKWRVAGTCNLMRPSRQPLSESSDTVTCHGREIVSAAVRTGHTAPEVDLVDDDATRIIARFILVNNMDYEIGSRSSRAGSLNSLLFERIGGSAVPGGVEQRHQYTGKVEVSLDHITGGPRNGGHDRGVPSSHSIEDA